MIINADFGDDAAQLLQFPDLLFLSYMYLRKVTLCHSFYSRHEKEH